MNIQNLRQEAQREFKLYVNPRKNNKIKINEKEYQYLGTVIYTGRGHSILSWLKEQNFLVRRQGIMATGEKINYYVRKKPIKVKLIYKLSKKELEELKYWGKNRFEKKYNIKLEENLWKFLTIRSDKKIIFYKKIPIKNINKSEIESYGTENRVHYYKHKKKKYLQIARLHPQYRIWTTDKVPIYEYKFQYELKKGRKK